MAFNCPLCGSSYGYTALCMACKEIAVAGIVEDWTGGSKPDSKSSSESTSSGEDPAGAERAEGRLTDI